MTMIRTVLAAALLAAAGTAGAAQTTIYRCGNAYADTPCAGALQVAAADTRSSAEAAAARETLARDRALARQLREDRVALQQENAVKGPGLFGIRGAGTPQPEVKPKTKAPKKPPKGPKTRPLQQPAAAA